MEKQVLSVEQMQELIALRVDTSKASMEWISQLTNWMGKSIENSKYHLQIKGEGIAVMGDETFDIIPTFTLQDILKILPKKIDGGGWVLSERYSDIPGEEDGAYIWYGREKVGITNGYTPLNAAFNMLKWCIKEDFIEEYKYVKNV